MRDVVKVAERAKKFARNRKPLSGRETPLQISLSKFAETCQKAFGPKRRKAYELLLTKYGLSWDSIFAENLTDLQHKILWEIPLKHRPKYHKASASPFADLHIAAQKILARSPSGKGLTACSLARELNVSRMTLYRKPYGKDAVRSVINFSTRHSGKVPNKEQQSNPEEKARQKKLSGDDLDYLDHGRKMNSVADEKIQEWYKHSGADTRKAIKKAYPRLRLSGMVTVQSAKIHLPGKALRAHGNF